MRRVICSLAMVGIFVAVLAAPANAVKPSNACGPGFDLGALTFEESLLLSNVQAGLADGIFDVADVTAGFKAVDRNNDGLICFRSLPTNANPASLLQYFYNTVDNNASVPSG